MTSVASQGDYTARARLFGGNRMKLGVMAFNCSHGSTIGQLDSDALFYLRSRGLGLLEARNLLTFAFAADVVQRIKIDPLRQRLSDYLVAKLAGGGAMRSRRASPA